MAWAVTTPITSVWPSVDLAVASAASVFDTPGLFSTTTACLSSGPEPVGHGARHGVGAAARRRAHEQAQRLVGPFLGRGHGASEGQQAARQGGNELSSWCVSGVIEIRTSAAHGRQAIDFGKLKINDQPIT